MNRSQVWRTPLLIAPVFAAWMLHLYWAAPGFLSFDAAYQLWQTRTLQYDNAHPVAMTLLWQLCNGVFSGWQGPMALLVVQSTTYFTAITWLTVIFARYGYWRAMLLGAMLALWPPFLLLQAHVWKDCLLTSAWALACAALLSEVQRPQQYSRTKLVLATLLLLSSALLRHNAILALPPLIFWIVWRLYPNRRMVQFTCAMVVVPALMLCNSVLARLVDAKPSPAWAVTALFDLTAEAIGTGQWHVPANLRADLPIERFAQAFKPYSGVPLFSAGIIVDGVSMPLSEQDKASLLSNWLTMPLRSPLAYLRHRGEITRIFLLPRSAEHPAALWFVPISLPYRDNPHYDLPRLGTYEADIYAFSEQFPCSIAFYIVLALVAYTRIRRGQDLESRLLKMILLAAACGFFPLLILMNSAEFRYGFSAMFSALLIFLWVFMRSRGAHTPEPVA